MPGDANVAEVAGLIGEPARAAVLMALLDGRALPATALAEEAGVAPSTASEHLGRLVDGGLITVKASGRHRLYRIAGPDVAEALEALARLAPARQVRSWTEGSHAEAIRRARTCYDHLAGRLGVTLYDAMAEQGILAGPSGLTDVGRARLAELGVAVDGKGRRPLVRQCIDWSERRPHLAGALGAAVLNRLVELEWIQRRPRRVVLVTDAGWEGLAANFGGWERLAAAR